jgi:flagellum-specific ATP synthase
MEMTIMAPEPADRYDRRSRRIPTVLEPARKAPTLAGQLATLARRGGGPVVGGRVLEVSGLIVRISGFPVRVGDVVELDAGADGALPCEVVGFRGDDLLAVPLGAARTITPGAPVWRCGTRSQVAVGEGLLGRFIDPFGAPLDGGPRPAALARMPVEGAPLAIAQRAQVDTRFATGLRVIDGLLPCGRGQRVGIFAGAGCGKSVLVEQIASHSDADVVVIGLIGERGREVRELMASPRRDRLVAVVATADRSPLERVRGAAVASAIAEWFRNQGKHVLLVIDSLTRYAMALREIGLSLGEPPATKGYPPSVFAALPRLLERVAPSATGGSITGFYTVLVEGDDLSDPVADSARSLLDAHIVLTRELADRGHFPAVDVLASASRVARRVASREACGLAERARSALATRRQVLELQALGAYTPGANPDMDRALVTGQRLDAWARQSAEEHVPWTASLRALAGALGEELPS